MRLKITTKVSATLQVVKEGFNQELFLSLNPPFPKVSLLQFGGSKKGDMVSLELDFLAFKQIWTSEIISDEESDKVWRFVDVGKKLPFFLKTWKHEHLVKARASGSAIVDNIEYTTGALLTDWVMYPLLTGQFLYRKPVYKRFFR